ncbi:MAG: hypothetical protein RR248_04215 [Clostridia bacterium]
MVQDIINEIVAIEQQSKKMIDEAEQKASDAICSAHYHAEDKLSVFHASQKDYVKNKIAEFTANAKEIKQKALLEKEQDAKIYIQKCSVNINKAVDYILENLI